MKKKILIVVGILAVAALIFGIGELGGLFPWQYLSEDKVNAFIEDSHYAFTYSLPDINARDEYDSILTNNLETEIAASIYAAGSDFALDTDGDAYIISSEKLNTTRESLFMENNDEDYSASNLLSTDGDSYLLHLKDVNTDLTYEIVESSYGLIGSESTYITVLYRLNGNECQIEYMLADDKNSPYKFKVTDIKAVYDEDDIVNNIDITGTWMAEHDETNTDDYYVLHFDYDGSGNLTNMADWLGLPFAYETDGNNIMTHMGSADDNTPMTYNPDDNVIIYDDVRYTFVYEKDAELVGRWDSEVDANGEYTELIIEPDGSGYVMNMPSNTGVPIRFEVSDDGTITTEVGGPDFTEPMTYDIENDIITYEDVTYTRED